LLICDEKYGTKSIYAAEEDGDKLRGIVTRLEDEYSLLKVIYNYQKKRRFALINEELIKKRCISLV
jgi:hypothetical protein